LNGHYRVQLGGEFEGDPKKKTHGHLGKETQSLLMPRNKREEGYLQKKIIMYGSYKCRGPYLLRRGFKH